MAFGRLHEEAAGDGKLLALSDAAFRMWACGLIYCQKNLTDGFIPEHAIHAFGVRGFDGLAAWRRLVEKTTRIPVGVANGLTESLQAMSTTAATVADELCRAQLPGRAPVWERVEGGYRVHDYLDWNDSREEIIKMRAQSRERMRRRRGEQPREQTPEQPREQLGEPSSEHPAEHAGEPVVRGSVDPEKNGSGKPEDARPGRRLGAGAAGPGGSPRDHLRHAFCDVTFSRCVPTAVHDKLANKLAPKYAGDRSAASAVLLKWYPEVLAGLPADAVLGDEFRFWQAQFDAVFAAPITVGKSAPTAGSGVPGVAATVAKYVDGGRHVERI